MITWQQLLTFIPIAGLILAVGRLLERISAMRTDLDNHKKAQTTSAKDQGRRIGNLESYVGLTADGIPVERMGGFSGRVRTPEGENDR
jgi:hypothetical protein